MQLTDASSFDLIVSPIVTEKAALLMEQNKYVFDVDRRATKDRIKQAIEAFFEVKVIDINTSNRPHKKRRVGRFIGYKPSYKRAIVTLAPGDKIELFPGL